LDWWGASRILDCAGKAKRRRRFSRALTFSQKKSGVALRFPPHSKNATLSLRQNLYWLTAAQDGVAT